MSLKPALLAAVLRGSVEPVFVNGTPIGASGTGIFAGFKLADGDDFDAQPSRWSALNPTGRYACGHLSRPTRGSSNFDSGMFIDPAWRGGRSESPTALGVDRISIANSILTITAALPEAEIIPFLPTTYGPPRLGDPATGRPWILTGSLKTAPSFMISAQADFALACKVKFPAGTIRGFWPSFWASTAHWPDYGEVDVMEGEKNSGNIATTCNVIGNQSDGAGTEAYGLSSPPVAPDRWITYIAIKKDGVVHAYDDMAVEGVIASRGTISELNSRLRGAWDIKLNFAVSNEWDGTTFNAADWPKTLQFDWWQAWIPATAGARSATQILAPVFTTAGGSWASTFPSKTTLFGSAAGIEQVHGGWDNEDAPGAGSWGSPAMLPGTMTVDLTARTTSGTVDLANGGRFYLVLLYGYDDGTPAGRALKPFNVAPVFKTLFSNSIKNPGEAFSATIAYTDFHSGNLGHTYNVTQSGGSWLNITGNGTTSVTISGTAPDADTSTILTIQAINSVGQVTTVNRSVTTIATASFNPITWSSVVDWWDASNNGRVFSDTAGNMSAVSGVDKVGAFYGMKANLLLTNTVSAATQPSYVTDANGKKALKFTRASNQRLICADAASAATADGDDNGYAIIIAAKRGATDNSVEVIAGITRDDAGVVNDYARHYFGSTNAVAIRRTVNNVGTIVTSANSVVAAGQWYTIAFLFAGTTVTVRLNGVVVVNAQALDTAALTLHKFSIGGLFENSTNAWNSGFAFDGSVGEVIMTDTLATNDATLLLAEAYLMAKWTN